MNFSEVFVDGSLKSGINSPVEVGSLSLLFFRVSAPSQVVVWDFSHQQYLLGLAPFPGC